MAKKKEEKTKRDDFKRPNGYGTCYRLSGNRRRPWVARVTDGRNEYNGRQIFRILGYYNNEQDCKDALDLQRIKPVTPKAEITLNELYDEWSAGKYLYISRQTADNYRAAWKYLSKYEDEKVVDIRTAHLQGVIDRCNKDKMSRSTLEKIRIVAVSLMNYAIENDVINKNYADFLRLPKSERVEKERFSDIEIKKLMDLAPQNEWLATVLIMIYTGMRISEMLNLTRFNVDMTKGVITGGVKTDAGKNRVIPIHSKITAHVKHWYDKEGQALICEKEGRAISPNRYRKEYYYSALEAAGVRALTPHACRHTFGSLMAAAGVDTVSIQRIIGHSDYSTTANIYTHVEIETLKAAMNKI